MIFENYFLIFNFLTKYEGNSSINLYLDMPTSDFEFIIVVLATNSSASLQSNNPIVGLSISSFSKLSKALT